jgi:ABC-2 type transport system permease protein
LQNNLSAGLPLRLAFGQAMCYTKVVYVAFKDILNMKYKTDMSDPGSETRENNRRRSRTRHYDMRFLLGQLVKKEFISKYKRTYLGVLWSVLGPLIHALVMAVVFGGLLRNRANGGFYIICGSFFYSFFSASTNAGMASLSSSSKIFSRLNMPKFIFVIATSLSSLVNFAITFALLLVIMPFVGLSYDWVMFASPVAIIPFYFFNLGISFVLSCAFVYFRDMKYLYSIVTQITMYFSAIFYDPEFLSENIRWLLEFNPIFHFIRYARSILINHTIPGINETLLIYAFAAGSMLLGIFVYRYNSSKLYYYIDA